MKKLLITGASGFLGSNFCKPYAEKFQMAAIGHSTGFDSEGISFFTIDLLDHKAIEHGFDTIKPDAVIHLAAISDPNYCELHPEESFNINITSTLFLAGLCKKAGIRFVFTSTDLVFDGTQAPYSEDDKTNPVNIYAKHKVQAENGLLAMDTDIVICRMPLMYGLSYTKRTSFLQPLLFNLLNRKEVSLFTDEFRTVLSAESACDGLALALDKAPTSSVIHLGGNERLSRYEIGEYICKVYGFNTSLLKPVNQKDVKMPALRPADVSLVNEKAKTILGWQPLGIEESLKRILEQNL